MSISLILGGARSGKSTKAEEIAQNFENVVYIATTRPDESGMEERIRAHRLRRPASWITLEKFMFFKAEDFEMQSGMADAVLLDCATLMASNLLFELEQNKGLDLSEREIFDFVIMHFNELIDITNKIGAKLIIVSNELGMGLVSEYSLGNIFRDLMGNINKYLASRADGVVFVIAGLDLKIKGEV